MAPVIFFLSFALLLASDVSSMHSSKAMEGYPAGYMSDCPGSTKKAVVLKKSLKNLSIVVQSNGTSIMARRTKYNYFQMKQLASDPAVDFKRRKTLFYVGGFLDSPSFPIAWVIGAHYSRLGYNVLMLDTNTFTTMEYPLASRLMRPVGKHAAEMLFDLTKLGLDPQRMEVVGLSLGGQTMSFVAKHFRELTGRNISRMTGLDPAGPCFRNRGPEDRLDSSDADFVEIIATNIDGFGMAAPVGHFNVYVNGGEYQPGEVMALPCNVLCSHIRSYTLWLAILENPDSFIAIQCDSVQQAREKNCFDRKPMITNLVGLKTDKSKQGIFFMPTTNIFPYFMGEKGTKKENDFVLRYLASHNARDVLQM